MLQRKYIFFYFLKTWQITKELKLKNKKEKKNRNKQKYVKKKRTILPHKQQQQQKKNIKRVATEKLKIRKFNSFSFLNNA